MTDRARGTPASPMERQPGDPIFTLTDETDEGLKPVLHVYQGDDRIDWECSRCEKTLNKMVDVLRRVVRLEHVLMKVRILIALEKHTKAKECIEDALKDFELVPDRQG